MSIVYTILVLSLFFSQPQLFFTDYVRKYVQNKTKSYRTLIVKLLGNFFKDHYLRTKTVLTHY